MLREFRSRISLRHLKENFLMILSSFAFMCLNLQRDPQKIAALPVSFLAILLFYSTMPGMIRLCRAKKPVVKIYAAFSSAGICLYAVRSFISRTVSALGPQRTASLLTSLSVVAAALSLVAVYVLTVHLLDHVWQVLRPLILRLSRGEKALCLLMTAGLMAFTIFAFASSRAFWNAGASYEVIYTSDSPSMIEPNVFLWLYHPENDLRQPLFAVFSAPLTAPAYLLAVPFSGRNGMITPLLMILIQIPLLILMALMLSGMLRLEKRDRCCFLLIAAVSYPTLLFSVMIEQYIIACFWLLFAAYSYTEQGGASDVSVSAAGGTLLTSLALSPFARRREEDGAGLRALLTAMMKAAAIFLLLFFAFGRLDTILSLGKKAGVLASFAGGGSLGGRINQYLSFARACFAAPEAAETLLYGNPSWQMTGRSIAQTDLAGVLIVLLSAVSVILCRKDRAVHIAGLWVGFSVLLLLVIGWGAPENGMVLYTLYFGWAFLILLFRLLKRAEEKTKAPLLTPLMTCIIVILLGWLNFHGMGELLAFAVSRYPV